MIPTDARDDIRTAIRRALAEDIGKGDVTTNRVVPLAAEATARLVAKQDGVIAGLDVAAMVFDEFDPKVKVRPMVEEGGRVGPGEVLAEIEGPARSILTAERTALNFLGRMSGIATLTRQFVDAVAGTSARILDTRKTAPGLRWVDRLAVLRGGGTNHRFGLDSMVLLKDNHIDFAGSFGEAVRRVREAGGTEEIEVEARTLEEVKAALEAGVRRVMLDNMDPGTMRRAVSLVRGRARLESSGGVDLANVREIAETGVDDISIGALTHSTKVLDVSLEVVGRAGSRRTPAQVERVGGGGT